MDKDRMNYSTEKEINLKELMWKILNGWRFLVISAVVFAILFGGYSYLKSWKNVKSLGEQSFISVEDQKKNLPKDEQEALTQLQVLQSQIEEKKEYQEKSILMNLDAKHQDIRTLEFYVNTHYVANYTKDMKRDYTTELLDAYGAYITSNGILEDIKGELKWKEKDSYIGELISEKGAKSEAGSKSTFTVTITGKDAEKAAELSDAVQKAIEEYRSTLEDKIGTHDLVLVDSYDSVIVNQDLMAKKTEQDNLLNNLQNQITALKSTFSDEQLQILNGSDEEEDEESTQIQPGASISAKYILLGVIVGVILSAFWTVLCYILNKNIKTSEECQDLYGVRILGNITPQKEKKDRAFMAVDRWLEKKQGKEVWSWEEESELILTNLTVTAKKEGLTQILFTTSLHLQEEEKERIYYFIDKLEKSGVKAVFAENMIRNARTFEQMSEMENVVLIEKVGATPYQIIEKQLLLCSEQAANVLGMIIFE